MEAGKIYPQARVGAALSNFFTPPNLEHLRNLTLREVAAHIEDKSRDDGTDAPIEAPDQVMVCLSSRGPDSDVLLRRASRLAGRLNRTWYALYVQTPREEAARVDAQTQRMVSDTLGLAHHLGATVFTVKGEDVAETIVQFAREYGVGHVVVGRSAPVPWWRRLFGERPLVEKLLEKARDLAVVVVDTGAPRPEPRPSRPAPPSASTPEPTSSLPGEPPSGPTSEPAPTSAPSDGRPEPPPRQLADYLDTSRIVIWDAPVDKEEVLTTLLERALADAPELDLTATHKKLQAREAQGSTFLEEGIALPHARLKGLGKPLVALGVTHGGLVTNDGAQATEVVWLLLLPEGATPGFMPTAIVTRMFKDDHVRQRLARTSAPSEALATIHRWEDVHRDNERREDVRREVASQPVSPPEPDPS